MMETKQQKIKKEYYENGNIRSEEIETKIVKHKNEKNARSIFKNMFKEGVDFVKLIIKIKKIFLFLILLLTIKS